MRWTQQDWAAVAEVSRAVVERAITEKEGCVELWLRTGSDPRTLLRALRAGVNLLEGRRARRLRSEPALERARAPHDRAAAESAGARVLRRVNRALPGQPAPPGCRSFLAEQVM